MTSGLEFRFILGAFRGAEAPLFHVNHDPKFRLALEPDADLLLQFMRAYYVFDGHGFDREKARVALIALLRDANLGRAWLGAGRVH